MRRILAFALALAAWGNACGGGSGDRSDVTPSRTASSPAARGPDALVLRVPRAGGVARVVAYPALDSTIWTSSDDAPPLERVLAFDQDAGLIAAVDTRGRPLWIDLRIGTVTIPSKAKLHGLISVDGSTIYGIGADGAVVRFAPSGDWVFKRPEAARAVFPQSNGTILVLVGTGAATHLLRVHPPDTRVLASVGLPNAVSGVGAPLGERVYFTTSDHSLIGVRARTLTVGQPIAFDHTIRAVATTPSGDRFYVITDSSNTLYVIDTFRDRIEARAELPAPARDLRVDPFGRYVLMRAANSDVVWAMAVGTNEIVKDFTSAWRGDAPFVFIDGAFASMHGRELTILSYRTSGIATGAEEFWYPFAWNGFRPRAAALDQPVRLPGDSDTTAKVSVQTESTVVSPPPAPHADSTKLGFTVSFAALLDETRAREAASKIIVNGQTARVVTGMAAGTAVYNVILGPYSTRDEADRIGRASGQSYVVIAGTP